MTYSLNWLADVLRAAGLTVVEQPGWQSRGQGDFGPPSGVLIHHTGSNPKGGNAPDLGIVLNGRADPPLSGPLCNLLVARDGTYRCIAAGHANHAGRGLWRGVAAGNSQMVGIEAENDGTVEPWPQVQMDALAKGAAAILEHIGATALMCAGHKEYALPVGRKVDPDFDMTSFRQHVAALMDGGSPVVAVTQTDPHLSMLREGAGGESVELLQKLLGIPFDGRFGPMTNAAVLAFQTAHGLKPDGLVGPATWKALGVKGNDDNG